MEAGKQKNVDLVPKTEQVIPPINQCEELEVPAENHVFDAWYLSKELDVKTEVQPNSLPEPEGCPGKPSTTWFGTSSTGSAGWQNTGRKDIRRDNI